MKINEVYRRRKDLYYYLTTTPDDILGVSPRYMTIGTRSETTFFGPPICLNSEEKAIFVGTQFFDIFCDYYGINP